LRGKQPEFGKLGAQVSCRREMDRMNAERAGSVHIRGGIVDIDGAFRVDRKALKQQFEDVAIGLDDPHLTRDQNAAKPTQKLEALESRRVGLGREIRKAIKGLPKALSSARISTEPAIGPGIISLKRTQ